MPDLFLSYSSIDRSKAEALVERLRTAGADIWMDHTGIGGATRWSTEIAGALEDCRALLLLLSPAAMASPNVIKEATLAAEWGKTIVPIDLEPAVLTKDFAYHLAGLQRIQHEDFESLMRTIKRLGIELKSPTKTQAGAAPQHGDKEQRKTLAVLPFEDLSPGKDHEWFSDGLTEELIATLSKLSALVVTSRTTIREYKNTKLGARAIGSELGVQYIVEGSVRKAGDNLRIAAQLIEVDTDSHLWSEVYKGTMADIFEVQESVARDITEALRVALSGKEEEVISKRPTENVDAYELYLQGKDYYSRRTRQSALYAGELFESALKLDPKFAVCRAALAGTFADLYYLYDRSEALLARAVIEAEAAVATDPMLPEAQSGLATVYVEQGENEKAVAAAQRAVELAPESASAYFRLAWVYFRLGKISEAAQTFETSLLRDPEELQTHWQLTICYHELKQKENVRRTSERALPSYERHVRRHPDDEARTVDYVIFLSGAGRITEAVAVLGKLLERPDLDGRTLYNAVCFYVDDCDDPVTGMHLLKRSVNAGWGNLERLQNDPDIERLRAMPEFHELIKQVEERLA